MNTEVKMILSIMENSAGYTYSNPDGGKIGTIRFTSECDIANIISVQSSNYETAYVINRISEISIRGEYNKILEVKKLIF